MRGNIPMYCKDKYKIRGDFLTGIILTSFIGIDLLRLFNVIPLMVGNMSYVLLGTISIIYTVFRRGIKRQIPFLFFIFLYTFAGAIGVITNFNIDLQELLWPFAFMGFSLMLLNFDISTSLTKNLFVFLSLFFIINIFTSGNVNNLSIISSRNTISIMILLYYSIYLISCYKNKKKASIYLLILGFIVVIMAVGRSGILTYSILTVFFLFFDFQGSTQRLRKPKNIISLLIIITIIGIVVLNIAENYIFDMIYNFNRRGLESIRTEIWSDYIGTVFSTAKNFIFGAPVTGTSLLDRFPNLHNSWLMLHSKYGLAITLLLLSLLARSYYYLIKTNNYLYLAILTAVLFRMQFDHTNFNAQLDIVFFYLIFFPRYSNSVSQSRDKFNTITPGRNL